MQENIKQKKKFSSAQNLQVLDRSVKEILFECCKNAKQAVISRQTEIPCKCTASTLGNEICDKNIHDIF